MKNTNFEFRQDANSKKWVIIAPKRSKRPGILKKLKKNFCPFCEESDEEEVFRIGSREKWLVRVIKNKFPFAPTHEIVIHSPDHHKNFEELPLTQVEKIFLSYQERFITHIKKGQVLIFNNHGRGAGESITHPHTQIAVVPFEVKIQTPSRAKISNLITESSYFNVFSPETSEWPWEVWIAPKENGKTFASSKVSVVCDLAKLVKEVLTNLSIKLGHEFSYNFYIYPGKDWYLRIMPRSKSIGGFELSSGIFVNNQDPQDTLEFLKKKFNKT